MGASKSTAQPTKIDEPTVPESVPIKAAETRKKPQAKEAAPVAEPISLPTQSWRSLLQEQPFNAEAKPFVPNQGKATPPRKFDKATDSKKQVSTASAVNDTDPEWMQYLSKKFEASAAPDAQKKVAPFRSNRGNDGKGKEKGKGAAAATPLDAGGGAGGSAAEGSGVVLHTDAYLKLLKEGGMKKRVPTNNQTARRTQNKNDDDAARADPESTESPLTISSLAMKWSTALQKSGLIDSTVEDEVKVGTTQDDVWIEKLLVDQDLSDPAYCSDTEQTSTKKNNASMHLLGCRPPSSAIRTYVMQDLSYELDQTVGMLLLRLQRFMDSQRIFIQSDTTFTEERALQFQQRRFVIGLKEVSRRTRQAKVECLIVAPDIEEDAASGGLDDRMRELLGKAYQNETPVIFALSRARLGKALGKSLNISVLGILDSTGSRELLKKSMRLASDGRQAWLDRLAK